MGVVDINDHMARACECGCVRFNLLRSGGVECDFCQQKQVNINWSEVMDLNYQPQKNKQQFKTSSTFVTDSERRTFEDAVKRCAVREAIHRAAAPDIRYYKNHPVPLSERVSEYDKQQTDWHVYDPREDPGSAAYGEMPA